MKETAEDFVPLDADVFTVGGLVISVVGILVIGIYPRPIFELAGRAARLLLQ